MKTHDYTQSSWGHSYAISDIKQNGILIDLYGWGYGLSEDDYIILKNGDDTTRYRLDSVKYMSDPEDMWFASATFAPREGEREN